MDEFTIAIGQLIAAGTCAEVPVKSIVMPSPSTIDLDGDAQRLRIIADAVDPVLERVAAVRDVGDHVAHQPLGLILHRIEIAAQVRRRRTSRAGRR